MPRSKRWTLFRSGRTTMKMNFIQMKPENPYWGRPYNTWPYIHRRSCFTTGLSFARMKRPSYLLLTKWLYILVCLPCFTYATQKHHLVFIQWTYNICWRFILRTAGAYLHFHTVAGLSYEFEKWAIKWPTGDKHMKHYKIVDLKPEWLFIFSFLRT